MTEFLASTFSNMSATVTSLFTEWHQFHFLRPEWFFLLILLVVLLWLKSRVTDKTQWHQVLPPHLSKVLLDQQQQKIKQNKWLTPLVWLIAITALAGPTWQKIEKPVFQVKRASVIVMDMSMSMRATDVKPNRLAKARFKAIDLAKAITDGEIALVAYAGDAFTISPLTPDNRNIVALIPSLSPEIMPEQGSYPVLGLNAAADLLKQAGYMSGDIYWLTDGVDQQDIDDVNDFISKHNYIVNIMSFGTAEGAPIKMVDNSLLKDASGSIVIPKLNARQLAQFSNISGGVFVQTTPSDIDIRTLTSAQSRPEDTQSENQHQERNNKESEDKSLTGDDWQEFGPTLILLILPLVLMAFRKGAVLSLMLVAPLMFNSQPSFAQSLPVSTQQSQGAINNSPNALTPNALSNDEQGVVIPESSWTDFVFDTKDQVANQAYQQGEFAKAQHTFNNEQWKGSAAYKAGDFETAYQHFQNDETAQGLYNQGNALANLGKIDEAIEAYANALKQQPNFHQAKENKALLEQMKQEQQDQQQNDQQQNDQNQDNQDGGQQQDSEQKSQQNQDQQNSEQNSEQDASESSQEQGENGQPQEAAEPSADPSQQESDSEQQNEQQSGEDSEQSEQEQQANEQSTDQQSEQQEGQQVQGEQLTPEELAEQENQQKLKQLLRKVSDDPSVLLRNKMILESRKRQQQRTAPKGANKSW